MPMDVSSSRPSNKANIFLGLIEYELNSLLGASHLVDYISVHIRFDLERYLLIICNFDSCLRRNTSAKHRSSSNHAILKDREGTFCVALFLKSRCQAHLKNKPRFDAFVAKTRRQGFEWYLTQVCSLRFR